MAPYSLIRAAEKIFFLAPQGFHGMGSTGSPLAIGKERFDRTFFADVDSGSVQMIIGAADPAATRVYWAYKSNSGTTGQFDKVLCYDYALDRAAIVSMSGEYLASLAKPGLTLESLDAIASGSIAISGAANNGSGLVRLTVATLALPSWAAPPDGTSVPTQLATGMKVSVLNVGGTTEANAESWTITVIDATHIDLQGSTFTNAYTSGGIIAGPLDAMTISLDDFSTNALSRLSAVNASHKLGFFAGANLEATLDTAEQALDGRRARVKGFRPITDAASCYGSVGARENVQSAVGYSAEQAVNAKGLCPANVSTRLAAGACASRPGRAGPSPAASSPNSRRRGRDRHEWQRSDPDRERPLQDRPRGAGIVRGPLQRRRLLHPCRQCRQHGGDGGELRRRLDRAAHADVGARRGRARGRRDVCERGEERRVHGDAREQQPDRSDVPLCRARMRAIRLVISSASILRACTNSGRMSRP
jgi:hypothetical protein